MKPVYVHCGKTWCENVYPEQLFYKPSHMYIDIRDDQICDRYLAVLCPFHPSVSPCLKAYEILDNLLDLSYSIEQLLDNSWNV